MKWHSGLLAPDPSKHRSYQWMRRGGWFNPDFPADVFHDIAVWLRTPGLGFNFHRVNFKISSATLADRMKRMPSFEELRNDVAENWLSVTREDAIKLIHMRVGPYRSQIPLLSQLKILDDIKAGLSQARIARDFGISPTTVSTIALKGAKWGSPLPAGFELLLGPQKG